MGESEPLVPNAPPLDIEAPSDSGSPNSAGGPPNLSRAASRAREVAALQAARVLAGDGGEEPTETTPLRKAFLKTKAGKLKAQQSWKQLRMYHTTAGNLRSLLKKPNRPPLPGSMVPPGYVINRQRTPDDAKPGERLRDTLLDMGSYSIILYLMYLWPVVLIANRVVFFMTFFHWVDFGYDTVPDSGCTAETKMPTKYFQCDYARNPESGTLIFSVDDYWNEQMAASLSWMLLYVQIVGLPWRISILAHMCNRRCDPNNDVGVDFYNRPSEFNFFHFPRRARWAIIIFLWTGLVCQFVQSALYIYPWNNVFLFKQQPHGFILLCLGPIQGLIFGSCASIVQMYNESKLHVAQPERFPPTVYDTCVEVSRLRADGYSWSEVWSSFDDIKKSGRTVDL